VSRGLGDVYKRQTIKRNTLPKDGIKGNKEEKYRK
jgi:hypothetical protein